MNLKFIPLIASVLVIAITTYAKAEGQTYTITVKNGTFEPAALEVPANQKIHLIIKNEEKVLVEFESYPLDVEEKIDSGESVEVFINPLDAGTYPIFDDKNPNVKGSLIAK